MRKDVLSPALVILLSVTCGRILYVRNSSDVGVGIELGKIGFKFCMFRLRILQIDTISQFPIPKFPNCPLDSRTYKVRRKGPE